MEETFITPEREKSLIFLLKLLDTSQKAILLRGPNRSGKSFFLRQLQHNIKREWQFYKIDKEDVAAGGEPLRLWAMAINKSQGGGHSLESRLMLWSRTDRTAVIVVEDAHLVSRESLYDLLLLNDKFDCLRVVMTSTDNLDENIESVCEKVDLKPFSQLQIASYVRAHFPTEGADVLELAGLDEEELFIETGGLPGRVNDTLRERLVDTGSQPKQVTNVKVVGNKKALKIVDITIGVVLFAGAVLTAVIFWPGPEPNLSPEPKVEATIAQATSDTQSEVIVLPINLDEDGAEVDIAGTFMPRAERGDEKVQKKNVDEVVDEGSEVTAKSNDKAVTAQPEKQAVITTAPQEEAEKEESSSPGPTRVSNRKEPEVRAIDLVSQHQWLASRKATFYTLQLFALSTEGAAQKYIMKQSNLTGLHYFKTQRGEKDLFVVLQGDFLSKKEAEIAAEKLTRTLKIRPWPRPFSAIQVEMAAL